MKGKQIIYGLLCLFIYLKLVYDLMSIQTRYVVDSSMLRGCALFLIVSSKYGVLLELCLFNLFICISLEIKSLFLIFCIIFFVWHKHRSRRVSLWDSTSLLMEFAYHLPTYMLGIHVSSTILLRLSRT